VAPAHFDLSTPSFSGGATEIRAARLLEAATQEPLRVAASRWKQLPLKDASLIDTWVSWNSQSPPPGASDGSLLRAIYEARARLGQPDSVADPSELIGRCCEDSRSGPSWPRALGAWNVELELLAFRHAELSLALADFRRERGTDAPPALGVVGVVFPGVAVAERLHVPTPLLGVAGDGEDAAAAIRPTLCDDLDRHTHGGSIAPRSSGSGFSSWPLRRATAALMAGELAVTDVRLRQLFARARVNEQVAAELAFALRGLTEPERIAVQIRYTSAASSQRDAKASRALTKLARPGPMALLDKVLARP
jgi:hypothetical protein